MIPSIQDFLKNPDDIDGVTASIQEQANVDLRADAMAHIDEAPQPAGTTERASAPRPRPGEGAWAPATGSPSSRWCTVPPVLVLGLVWLPALGSVALSFGKWNGFGGLDTIEWVGFQNYQDIATIYPAVLAGHPAQPDLAGLPLRLPHAAGHAARRDPRPRDEGQPVLPDRVLHAGGAVPGADRLHLAALLLPRPGPASTRSSAPRSTGTATRTSTCGRSWSRPPGGTPATSC